MKVNLRGGGHREITTDLERLPVTVTRRSGPLMGLFVCLFALAWGGFPLIALFGLGAEADRGDLWVAYLFPLFAVGLFLYGLFLIRHRKTVTIDRARIAVDEQRLFKAADLGRAAERLPGGSWPAPARSAAAASTAPPATPSTR